MKFKSELALSFRAQRGIPIVESTLDVKGILRCAQNDKWNQGDNLFLKLKSKNSSSDPSRYINWQPDRHTR